MRKRARFFERAPPPSSSAVMENGSYSLVALFVVRVGVGVCSSLSIVGACAIIISYAAFPELRTVARQLLLNRTVADILLALSFLLGLIQTASEFCLLDYNSGWQSAKLNGLLNSHLVSLYLEVFEDPSDVLPYWLCETQAFFIIFASDAAVLWTLSIGVYFFVTIALQRPRQASRMLPVFYFFSWGIPLGVSFWLVFTKSLGRCNDLDAKKVLTSYLVRTQQPL